MRIIICCNMYPPNFIGGAELVAHYQAKALRKLGHEIIIFAGDPSERRVRHEIVKDTYDGIDVLRVALTQEDYSQNSVNFFHRDIDEQFEILLDGFSPDVVHFHNIVGLSLGMIHRAKRKGATTVLTVHDHWGFCHKNTVIRRGNEICSDYSCCSECLPFIHDGDSLQIPNRIRRDYIALMLGEIDLFVSPSQYLAKQYINAGIGHGKFSVIWNGVDVNRFTSIRRTPSTGKMRFTFVGYFGKHKGVHTFLGALRHLADKSKVLVNLVGDGEELQNYRKIVEDSGWSESVKFWGKIDNRRIEEVYGETDVLVLPSIWPENQPVSITEAMSAGIPVIASRMGGNTELVDDGTNGILFQAGDARDLAQKMSYLLENPDKAIVFGKNAQSKMAENSFEKHVIKILAEYRKRFSLPSEAYSPPVVVCVGDRIDEDCLRVISQISAGGDKCRFVLGKWLEQDQLSESTLFWIVDRRTAWDDIEHLLHLGVPLIVPSRNRELKAICQANDCGLYYDDKYEAEACVEYLLRNELKARAIGRNCRNALRHHR